MGRRDLREFATTIAKARVFREKEFPQNRIRAFPLADVLTISGRTVLPGDFIYAPLDVKGRLTNDFHRCCKEKFRQQYELDPGGASST